MEVVRRRTNEFSVSFRRTSMGENFERKAFFNDLRTKAQPDDDWKYITIIKKTTISSFLVKLQKFPTS